MKVSVVSATLVQILRYSFVTAQSAPALEDEYDYVIVGGGVTGLVVANRLSEDSSISVLVIESGESVDDYATMIPYEANSLTASDGLRWDITSLPEPGLANSTYPVLVAKVLGGGSVINGMVYDRGSAADYDAWKALGNEGWGWEDVLPYFKKGTTFQPPSKEVANSFNITWNPEVYGDGPLAVSITDTQFPDIRKYWSAWKAMGVHVPLDGNEGDAYGPSWYGNTMDKKTGRRAHARYAYIDPIIAHRPNLKIVTGTTAERILFHDEDPTKSILATGVQATSIGSNMSTTFSARKEVILAAGAIQTPKLLQLSGIGPRSVLEAAGVQVKVELDAVGSNFQDHPYATLVFNTTHSFPIPSSLDTNATYNASAWEQYETNHTGPYTYARGNALAFMPLPDMTSNISISSLITTLRNRNLTAHLPALYTNSTKLLAGFTAQKSLITNLFTRKDAAVSEFPIPADGTVSIVTVEKPLSRGTVHINPLNPSGPPNVLHNAFFNPIDRSILSIGIRYLRKVLSRPELSSLSISEVIPGAQYTSDEEIFSTLLAKGLLSPTLAHPSCSCPMMPEELGGCVNDELLVYGTRHLSIVDASIFPLIPSQHLQATAYMVGEKAADLIKGRA